MDKSYSKWRASYPFHRAVEHSSSSAPSVVSHSAGPGTGFADSLSDDESVDEDPNRNFYVSEGDNAILDATRITSGDGMYMFAHTCIRRL